MSAFQSKFSSIEAQLGEFHQRIDDSLDIRDPNGRVDYPIERLTTLRDIIFQFSVDSKTNGPLQSDNLVNVISKSCDRLRASLDVTSESDVLSCQLSNLSWLVSAKASIQALAALLKAFSDNVHLLNEEIQYWENVLESRWGLGLFTLQTFPLKIWRRNMELGRNDNSSVASKHVAEYIATEARPSSSLWVRLYDSARRCNSLRPCSFQVGLFSSLNESKLEIQRKKRKLKLIRDLNASLVGLLFEECLSFGEGVHKAGSIDEFTDGLTDGSINGDLSKPVRATVGTLKSLLQTAGNEDGMFKHAENFIGIGEDQSCWEKYNAGFDLDAQGILRELIYLLTDLLPRYKQVSTGCIVELGRPSASVRYWLPISLALVSTTTSLKIARDAGPVLVELMSNLGATTLDFWRNWVVSPTWKLIRTIRHDEKSDIALMSKSSLEADRASLERMVVDFVLDRGEHSNPAEPTDFIADKVREGDLTPVLRAYEKDLRSPFVGTIRGDLVRTLLIQIQKTKVDVEVAMSGIDALLKSQELVFGFVGLTPGLLISYASIRWLFGILGSRKGFRLGRKQDDLRYALRKLHRILSTSSPTAGGRLTYRDQGLLLCNVETLLNKAQVMLKGEDLRAFKEDTSDLVNENRGHRQLQIVERMAWTYSKWT
ncbi:hypothetical protein ASPSYDRAFT_49036 [Aspergillus sydowii CBS 593.65]|uniref:Nuclear control of ATPase protein 2 n=1 Tax=Aspergillus sydowii CBS 593.65 TaxID=1036612 RepID=A0A1L9T8P5_9EURO|nr:uncharacterized protein ASPSYDRAFT_49036 [Aspergillus sydowii CBS 593.65]OJJ55797.1 hypothetical protein ASPSYDRAFT_49036 [Aspergillus sydowii CBS 593.65]